MIEDSKKTEARAESTGRDAAAYRALVAQAILGKGIVSIAVADAPKLLARLVARGIEAEWHDDANGGEP